MGLHWTYPPDIFFEKSGGMQRSETERLWKTAPDTYRGRYGNASAGRRMGLHWTYPPDIFFEKSGGGRDIYASMCSRRTWPQTACVYKKAGRAFLEDGEGRDIYASMCSRRTWPQTACVYKKAGRAFLEDGEGTGKGRDGLRAGASFTDMAADSVRLQKGRQSVSGRR